MQTHPHKCQRGILVALLLLGGTALVSFGSHPSRSVEALSVQQRTPFLLSRHSNHGAPVSWNTIAARNEPLTRFHDTTLDRFHDDCPPSSASLLWMTSLSSTDDDDRSTSGIDKKPQCIAVVGATGRVGRRVVQKCMARNIPVKAIVRSAKKAQELFGTSTSLQYPKLDVCVVDTHDTNNNNKALEDAIQASSHVISVVGVSRFSKWFDFLPWKFWRPGPWPRIKDDDLEQHPYFGNYIFQKELIRLAVKAKCQRFVRLTGLSNAYSAFHPISVLFNSLLSLANRYHILCEQVLWEHKDELPFCILRPGGLRNDVRNVTSTHVQVASSGKLPLPSRIGRDDVAELCVQACIPTTTEQKALLPSKASYILACRWCSEELTPTPQGTKDDGFATVQECYQDLAALPAEETSPPFPRLKPYRVSVSLAVYTMAYVTYRLVRALTSLTVKLIHG